VVASAVNVPFLNFIAVIVRFSLRLIDLMS
jgi:hypothetical protein